MSDVALAQQIASLAHEGQLDRAGQPYIEHVRRVVENLVCRWGATDCEIAAAWLHDVIEDTAWTIESLIDAGISPQTATVVGELTRPAGSTYLAWIRSLCTAGSTSAIRVKLADNEDNSAQWRVDAIPDGERIMRERYLPARVMLEERIARDEASS